VRLVGRGHDDRINGVDALPELVGARQALGSRVLMLGLTAALRVTGHDGGC
jgi:hypothetical protein